MEARISDWKNKALSFAGRLQLVKSVLSSMNVYWASVFILPASIVKELEKKMRGFLWCQGPMVKGKAKVAWKDCCLPKDEGGLGIRRLCDVNKALMTSHIWSILNKRPSLWVNWVYTYKLKGRNFWDVPLRAGAASGWRKLLLLRNTIRPHVCHRIGNGESTSAWFDSWLPIGPLCNYISNRDFRRAGFTADAYVTDLIRNDNWTWPIAWYDLFPVLINIKPPTIQPNVKDQILWKDSEGREVSYSSSTTWDSIRLHQQSVPWVDLVWFSHSIPRHSFHVWLIMKEKLKTQDKMKQWDVSGSTNLNLLCCSLCKTGPDSHEHLFFECDYAKQVWNLVKPFAMMHHVACRWKDITEFLLANNTPKLARCVIGKILLAATAYYVWQERNCRLFTSDVRSAIVLSDLILSTVRLKLVTMKFKRKTKGLSILDKWKIEET